jgi:hypothetical protein
LHSPRASTAAWSSRSNLANAGCSTNGSSTSPRYSTSAPAHYSRTSNRKNQVTRRIGTTRDWPAQPTAFYRRPNQLLYTTLPQYYIGGTGLEVAHSGVPDGEVQIRQCKRRLVVPFRRPHLHSQIRSHVTACYRPPEHNTFDTPHVDRRVGQAMRLGWVDYRGKAR